MVCFIHHADGVQGHLDNISTYIIVSGLCCPTDSEWPLKRGDSCSATYASRLAAFLLQPKQKFYSRPVSSQLFYKTQTTAFVGNGTLTQHWIVSVILSDSSDFHRLSLLCLALFVTLRIMGLMRGMCWNFGVYFGSLNHHYTSLNLRQHTHSPFAGCLMHVVNKDVKCWLKMNSSDLTGWCFFMNYEHYYCTNLGNFSCTIYQI